MKANNYISKREHNLLTTFAFTVFVCLILFISLSLIEEVISQPNAMPKVKLSGDNGLMIFPPFHLITFFIFLAILKTKRFLLSFLLTIFYAFIFIYGLSARFKGGQLGGEEFSPKVDLHLEIYYAANGYDYFAAFFISILLFWQISILLRMLIKTSQKESVLP